MYPTSAAYAVLREKHASEAEQRDRIIRGLFPGNVYVQRLLKKAEALHVFFLNSEVEDQWLYHPDYRTLCIWLPDIHNTSLSYLVVMLAHELGHVLDFDAKPHYLEAIKDTPWFAVPPEIELSAFVTGFGIIQELEIPITLDQYCAMIEGPMADLVAQVVTGRWSLTEAVGALKNDVDRQAS